MSQDKKINQDKFTFNDIANIYRVRNLARILGIKTKQLILISQNTLSYYRPFDKKQKNKIRKIDNPTGELKHIQGKINKRLLLKYPLPKEIFTNEKLTTTSCVSYISIFKQHF